VMVEGEGGEVYDRDDVLGIVGVLHFPFMLTLVMFTSASAAVK